MQKLSDPKPVIQTGVDKLVALVQSKKRISIGDAAKELSMPKVVIEEWANFLEEKEIITIEYKFTTPYLIIKTASKEQVQAHAKEFESRKEGFVRKVNATLQFIESETAGLGEIKKEFEQLSREVEKDVKHVRDDLEVLERYEHAKRDLDKEILLQQQDLKEKINSFDSTIQKKKEEYQYIVDKIKSQELQLYEQKSKTEALRKNEGDLLKDLDRIQKDVTKLREGIISEQKAIDQEEEHIGSLKDTAEGIKKDFEQRKLSIQPLIEESKKREAEILEKQRAILDKVLQKKREITSSVDETREIRQRFETFFDKKVKIDVLVDRINIDVQKLKSELSHLINDANAINLSTKTINVKEQIEELEKNFAKINHKRSVFEEEIYKLFSLIKGNK